jgi:hypothetical protein
LEDPSNLEYSAETAEPKDTTDRTIPYRAYVLISCSGLTQAPQVPDPDQNISEAISSAENIVFPRISVGRVKSEDCTTASVF